MQIWDLLRTSVPQDMEFRQVPEPSRLKAVVPHDPAGWGARALEEPSRGHPEGPQDTALEG